MHHLFLVLDYLVRIIRAQLCKDLKVSYLQANAKLAQKGEHQTKTPEVPSFVARIFVITL